MCFRVGLNIFYAWKQICVLIHDVQKCWLWEFSFYIKIDIYLGNSHSEKKQTTLPSPLFIKVLPYDQVERLNTPMENDQTTYAWNSIKPVAIILRSQTTESVAIDPER